MAAVHSASFAALVLAALAAFAHGDVATKRAATPILRVVDMLQNVHEKVEKAGLADKKAYEEFHWYCYKELDNRQYAVKQETTKIDEAGAKITQLGTAIASSNDNIASLSTQITETEGKDHAAQDRRNEQHEEYLKVAAELTASMEAIQAAMDQLRAAKGEMSLAQLQDMATHMLGTLSKSSRVTVSEPQVSMLDALSNADQQPAAYKFRSNDIIATLQSLMNSFRQNKEDLDQEEWAAASAFTKQDAAYAYQEKSLSKAKSETETVVDQQTEAENTEQQVVTTESAAKDANENFIQTLSADCEAKTKAYQERTTVRSNELKALESAVHILKTGEIPMSAVLVKSKQGKTKAVVPASKPKAISFLQLRGSNSKDDLSSPSKRAIDLISKAATKLHSSALTTAAVQMNLSGDDYVKVRGLIKDLIARLEADASSELGQKTFCDTNMKEGISSRDSAQIEIEDVSAKISAHKNQLVKLGEDIVLDNKVIADDKQSESTATNTRTEEHAGAVEAIESAKVGEEAVGAALNILKQFYSSHAEASFGQVSQGPEFSGDSYHGEQTQANGIIGLLETLLADFQRTEETVTAEDAAAQKDFTNLVTDLNTEITDKNDEISVEEKSQKQIQADLVDYQDDLVSWQKQLEEANKSLEHLKAMCVDGGESYEARQAARKKEIEALKTAMQILGEMSS